MRCILDYLSFSVREGLGGEETRGVVRLGVRRFGIGGLGAGGGRERFMSGQSICYVLC